MSRRRAADNDPDDDWSDSDELPEGVYHDDEIPTVPCPYCRREISEEAERCPHCENYLSREDAPSGSGRSPFWIVAMILALAAALWWVLR